MKKQYYHIETSWCDGILAFPNKKEFETWMLSKGWMSYSDVTKTVNTYNRQYSRRITMSFKERLKYLFLGEKMFIKKLEKEMEAEKGGEGC